MASKPGNTLLVIGKIWPEPASSAAGYRLLQIIQMFKGADYSVTFACAASKSDFSIDPETLGMKSVEIELNSSSFDDFIVELNPAVVLFDRFMTEEQFGWRVAENCPDAIRILDSEDLHFWREARRLALKKGGSVQEHLLNETALRELSSMYRCDLSLMISDAEMELLRSIIQFPETLLHYLPFLLNEDQFPDLEAVPTFEERAHFVTIGNFFHEPNRDSMLYLKQEIWPGIRKKLPKAELHIYGAYTDHKIQQLHNEREGFLIKGRAEDAKQTISNYRILLTPLRFGAGLKGKLLDAMLTGTPSITSEIGAEGMGDSENWPGSISLTPNEIIESAVNLYEQEDVWKSAQSKISDLVKSRFSRSDFESVFLEIIQKMRADLTAHRNRNVTGRILEHQSNRATKYMSKWIEEKNRK